MNMPLSRKEALRQLWLRGDIVSLLLEPHQIEMLHLMNQPHVELFYGDLTRRGGKTYAMVTDAIAHCIKEKMAVRYATSFLSDLIEFILPTFEAVLESCPEDLKPVYTSFNKTYTFPNGSKIKLVGLDKNPNGLRGNAIRRIYLDECGFVANLEYIHKSVIIPATARRKGQKKQKIKIVCITTPPENATDHYCYELKVRAESEPTGEYFKRTLDEIDSIDDDEKERLLREVGGRNSITARREFFCEWIVDEEQAVCPTFDEVKHVKDVEAEDFANWVFSGDIGGVIDRSVGHTIFWSHVHQKVVFWDERFHDPNTPTSVLINSMQNLCAEIPYGAEKENPPNLHVFCDAHGQTRVDFATAKWGTSLPPKEDFDAGIQLLRNAFYNDEIIVHPRCKLLIATLKSGLLTKNRKDYLRTKALGHCDAVANAIYGIRVVNRKEDRRPGLSRTDRHIRNFGQKKKNPMVALGWSE